MRNLAPSAQQKQLWALEHRAFLLRLAANGEHIADGGCIHGETLDRLNRLAADVRTARAAGDTARVDALVDAYLAEWDGER